MRRIAVIFESSPFDRKGLFNAVHNRIKGLLATGECRVDAYCIHSRDNALTRRLRHTSYVPQVDSVSIDEVTYRMIWYRFSILDHLILEKSGRRPLFFKRFIAAHADCLKGYDYVIAHSFTGALFAYEAYRRFGTPYFVTWHGSDVHTHPWRVDVIREDTKKVMESARCNFFVSKALMAFSERITSAACKKVLYNGVSEEFVRLSDDARQKARERFGIGADVKVVAFAGNLVSVKNVLALPHIFKAVAEQYDAPLHFIIAGDGKLRKPIEAEMLSMRVLPVDKKISLLGNVAAEDMPTLMNCVDVLVLPSLNEGLPLVCAEALKCGANVVGSDVGGIAEVIGRQNVVPLGDDFVPQMAAKIVAMLNAKQEQNLPPQISWAETTALELSFLK
jgi:glycosyltransferase involved in cell wall biosynthesis